MRAAKDTRREGNRMVGIVSEIEFAGAGQFSLLGEALYILEECFAAKI